jgi:uncharacterized spore protein YtfJ
MTQAVRNDAMIIDTLRDVVEHATAGTVFGTPISRDGVTVLPVAKVSGGGGGGSAPDGGAEGSGGGMGLSAKPLGVYILRDTKVQWRPAIDLNKVILGGQIVAVVALLVIRAIVKARTPAAATVAPSDPAQPA